MPGEGMENGWKIGREKMEWCWKLGCLDVWLIILINQQRDEILNSCIELMIYHLSGLTQSTETAVREGGAAVQSFSLFLKEGESV